MDGYLEVYGLPTREGLHFRALQLPISTNNKFIELGI